MDCTGKLSTQYSYYLRFFSYLRHRKEKKRDKKKAKKEEKELDAKETRMETIAFGDIVDRPPTLQAAPKMKKKY